MGSGDIGPAQVNIRNERRVKDVCAARGRYVVGNALTDEVVLLHSSSAWTGWTPPMTIVKRHAAAARLYNMLLEGISDDSV